jgi:hypothetical protein
VTTQTDIINNDGQKHLITPPFTIRSYTIVNNGALSVFVLDGLGNRLDVVDPGETTSANWGGTSLTAQFAAATTGSATIITSDTATTPASSYTPGFGPSAVSVASVGEAGPPVSGVWTIPDNFAYLADTYEIVWWRAAGVAANQVTYNVVFQLQDASGAVLDTGLVVFAPLLNGTVPGRDIARRLDPAIQRVMQPGQHFQLVSTATGVPATGQATLRFTLGIRRRTFTS